jgi:hypothetical protein
VDASDEVISSGNFSDTVDLGGGSIISAGLLDAWLAKFRCEHPLPVTIQSFVAIARPGAVELRWDVWREEVIDSYEIARTNVLGSRSEIVAQGAFDSETDSFVDTLVEPGKSYDYVLTLRANGKIVARSPVASATTPLFERALGQNYPNPFNPSTAIDVTVAKRSVVVVAIYDARGARVATLDAGVRDAGTLRLEWNGIDDAGKRVGSGVYFYRLDGAGPSTSRKMLLLK